LKPPGDERKRVARPGPRRRPFVIQVFTLLVVAFSEAVFRDEFSVRFNFIAVDSLVFIAEVIGNIRESCPAWF